MEPPEVFGFLKMNRLTPGNDSRQRRITKQQGNKIRNQNLDDLAKSERATYVCWHGWLSNSTEPTLRLKAREMSENAQRTLLTIPASGRAIYTKETLAKVRMRMDEISERWKNSKVGETLIVDW